MRAEAPRGKKIDHDISGLEDLIAAVIRKNPGLIEKAEKEFFSIPEETTSDVPDYQDTGTDFSGGHEEDKWGHTQIIDDREWRAMSPGLRNRLQNYDAKMEMFAAGFEWMRQRFKELNEEILAIRSVLPNTRSARF